MRRTVQDFGPGRREVTEYGARASIPIEVDPVQLEEFLCAASAFWISSNNISMKSLLQPIFVHMLAIYSRCENVTTRDMSRLFEPSLLAEAKLLVQTAMPI